MDRYLEMIEPALADAQVKLAEARTALSPLNGTTAVKEALDALRACWGYLTLFRKPVLRTENPTRLLATCFPEGGGERVLTRAETVTDCVYDREQVVACVEGVVGSARLGEDSRLWVELFEEENVPQIAISLDGPGSVPEAITFGGYVDLSMEELGRRWTAATRGGRIDKTANGVALRLKGIRDTPESVEGLEPILDIIMQAERQTKSAQQWLGLDAEGVGRETAPGGAWEQAIRAAADGVESALRVVDGAAVKMEPADLSAVLAEVEGEWRHRLGQDGIRIETLCDAKVPPLMMYRRGVRVFIHSVVRWGLKALTEGGVITILMEYSVARRACDVAVTFTGDAVRTDEVFYASALRRIAVEQHGGGFEWACDGGEMTLSATFPDPVGEELSEWIPGFDAFSDRSKQMLRLLKGAGQAGLEAVILAGVLEEELERWLLPRLEDATTIHLARDLNPDNHGLAGSSQARLEKALGQVQRGKPRKEICKPQYAGELLWAFRVDERHRAALGVDVLDDAELKGLCAALLQSPTACLVGLRTVARVVGCRFDRA